jgi:DNA segregation ATPase FtsK/SpoIIIE-like protein
MKTAIDTIEHDEMYAPAIKVVRELGKGKNASISFVQRNLLIGYNRAARLLEAMEYQKIVSPLQLDGTRRVL